MTYQQLDLFATDDEEGKIKKEVEGIDFSPLFERLAKSQFRSSFPVFVTFSWLKS